MSRTLFHLVLLPVVLAAFATNALAHARLKKADPPAGGAVSTSPNEIRLQFSEGVEPKFSGIALTRDGEAVQTGAATIDTKDRNTLIVPVMAPLPAGPYTVNWHAVSSDTHKTEGSFTFEVRP
jgi:methionine-rich copper-binding protein CopC